MRLRLRRGLPAARLNGFAGNIDGVLHHAQASCLRPVAQGA